MTNPPSSAPTAMEACGAAGAPRSSSSSSRSSWPSLSQRMSVGCRAREQGAEPRDLAVDPLRREEPDLEVHRLLAGGGAARTPPGARATAPATRTDLLAPRHVLAQPPGDLEMVLGLAHARSTSSASGPAASSTRRVSAASSSRSELRTGAPPSGAARAARRAPDRQHRHLVELLERALRGQVEPAERGERRRPTIRSAPACVMPKPYTSTMPPRTLNSATSVTVGTRRYPIDSSAATTALRPGVSRPARREPEACAARSARRHAGALGRWRAPSSPGSGAAPRAAPASVSTRSPAIS